MAFVRKKTKNKKKQLGEAKKTTIEPNYFMNKISRKIYGYADGNRSKITQPQTLCGAVRRRAAPDPV